MASSWPEEGLALEPVPAVGKMLATPLWLPFSKLIIMHIPRSSRGS